MNQEAVNPLEHLRLVRNRSNASSFSGSGYLFLAIVFCMMCCSSLYMSSSNAIKSTIGNVIDSSQFRGISIPSFETTRKLMSAESPNKISNSG
jgi:hypothetical protein